MLGEGEGPARSMSSEVAATFSPGVSMYPEDTNLLVTESITGPPDGLTWLYTIHSDAFAGKLMCCSAASVSYTHLTLPTIPLV